METNNSMSLQEALDHLEKTNRRIPIMKLFSVWVVDDMELLDQECTQEDRFAFFAVALALNDKVLDPSQFLPLNAKREDRYSEAWLKSVSEHKKLRESMLNNSGFKREELEIVVSGNKVKVKINDQVVLSPHDNPDKLEIDTITHIYNPAVQDLCFQIRTNKYGFDFTNFFDILSVYRPIIVHENPLTTQMKKLI